LSCRVGPHHRRSAIEIKNRATTQQNQRNIRKLITTINYRPSSRRHFPLDFTMVDGILLGAESAAAAVENAAERQFGPEFEDIHILSNAQVAVILQVSARSSLHQDQELNEVYRKTQKYVERFNTMTNPEKDHQELVDELDNLQEYVY
jgi:hypothetical protein